MEQGIENEYIQIQNRLKEKICLQSKFDINKIQYAAGIDLAYFDKNNEEYATCNIVIADYNTKKVVEQVEHYDKIKVPYIAGFLAFRELPLILATVRKLEISPDIYMFDGNGYLHQRHMGIATHASFYLNKPTIGVAKKYLKIKGIDFKMPKDTKGAYTDIVIDGEVYGRCLRTRKGVKPVFVSCGNYIDLQDATAITLHFIEEESRLPILTRLADLATHESRKKHYCLLREQ